MISSREIMVEALAETLGLDVQIEAVRKYSTMFRIAGVRMAVPFDRAAPTLTFVMDELVAHVYAEDAVRMICNVTK